MNRVRFSLKGAALTIACCCISGAAAAAPAAPAAQQMPQDDPAKVAQAKQFLLAYHPKNDPKNLAMMLDKMMPRMIAGAKQQDPKLDVKKFEAERRAQMMAQAVKAIDFQSHIISRHFSMQELKALTAFYTSPLGRKLNDEIPKIQRDLRLLRPLDSGPQFQRPKKPITIRPMDNEKPAPAPHK